MTAGRPQKSLAQKLADGSFRADRANLNEPQPSPFDTTNPFSEDADLEAFKKWEEIVPELMDRYSIGRGDRGLVQAYCVFYQRALRADDELEESGRLTLSTEKGVIINPAVKISESCWDRVVKFGSQLGLDPINRRRIRGPKQGPLGIVPETMSLVGMARDRTAGPDDPEPPLSTGDPLVDSL